MKKIKKSKKSKNNFINYNKINNCIQITINNIIYIDNLHMRLIPEWNNHTNCLIAWPCNQDLYGNRLHQAMGFGSK